MKILWTDGSADPNPGPGGWVVIEKRSHTPWPKTRNFKERDSQPVLLGSDPHTTNIRMEGTAIIQAMKYAGAECCEIHTDSEFWINVLTKWAPVWQRNGWAKKTGPIKNLEMVQEMYALYTSFPVELVWVRGHAGARLNELADLWAKLARKGATLRTDPRDDTNPL